MSSSGGKIYNKKVNAKACPQSKMAYYFMRSFIGQYEIIPGHNLQVGLTVRTSPQPLSKGEGTKLSAVEDTDRGEPWFVSSQITFTI